MNNTINSSNKNIIFIGYRATGKSTLAKYISDQTGLTHIDTDELIEQYAGISISNIFDKYGEMEFRRIESRVLSSVSANKNTLISTGAGVVERYQNRSIIKNMGIVILLLASVETICNRLRSQNTHRPRLIGEVVTLQEETRLKLKERTPYYDTLADYRISTDNESIKECGAKIIKNFSLC